MERYGVSLRIQSECGKMQTRITPNTDTFYAVHSYGVLLCGFLKDLTKTMVSLRQ